MEKKGTENIRMRMNTGIRKLWLLVLLAVPGGALFAQTIRIGLYHDQVVSSFVFYCSEGKYRVFADDNIIVETEPGEILYLTLSDSLISVFNSEQQFGAFSSLEIKGTAYENVFRVKPVQPSFTSRSYDDDLLVLADDRFMTLINRVDMDKYLAGVVEAEAGPNAPAEFYKAQSILCRTYALKYLDKHMNEGFSLCDGVHCQAFKGRSTRNPGILQSILETSGLVLADFNYKLIIAAFHSNSGGQTTRAADAWIADAPYLQSVVDPYSLHQPHAKWQDTISFRDWKNYLLENGMESVKKIPDEIIYIEQMRRKKYFILDKDSIRMSRIREDWGFKSSFFDMFPEGDSILVWGKGYGHGVGMSQEGAMKMASDGYSYQDILQFYFFEVRLMDYRDLPDSSIPDVEFQ